MRVHYTGVVSFPSAPFNGVRIVPKFEGKYSYSLQARRKLLLSEKALHGNADFLGLWVRLITITFPECFTEKQREEVSRAINDRIRKRYKCGVWWTEKHKSGKLHYHYKVATNKSMYQDIIWIRKQQEKDGVATNSYSLLKRNMDEDGDYTKAYTQAKYEQQDLTLDVRLWSSWGLDRNPLIDPDWKDLQPVIVTSKGNIISKRKKLGRFISKSNLNERAGVTS